MAFRRTLKRPVACTGIGLHSGKPVRLTLKPAPSGDGLRFFRTDVGVEIPASLAWLSRQDHATTLSQDGVSVETVEHLLAALYALGVDDCLVEVSGPEIPILDGSAAPFVILIHEAGTRPHKEPREYLKITKPVEVVRGKSWPASSPPTISRSATHRLRPSALAAPGLLPSASRRENFAEELAPARTFGFLRDVEAMRRTAWPSGGASRTRSSSARGAS